MNEIYLRPYPALDRAWQVSEGGGVQARWNPSGTEVFYRDGSRLLAVSVDLSRPEPVRQRPRLLFEQAFASSTGTATPNYDVTPVGTFVVLRPREATSRLILSTNWAHALAIALDADDRRQ